MYKHILVPTDGSALSLKAAKAAGKLARELNAKVTTLVVTPPYTPANGGESAVYYTAAFTKKAFDAGMKEHAEQALEQARKALGVEAEGVAVEDRTPWEAIIKNARARKCDLIVMASHGRRGIASLLLGSETTKVLTHSKTPVLVCR